MADRLDKTGLAYLWNKIVAKISSKKINQVEPLSENLDTGAISRLSTGNISTTNATRGVLQTFQATSTMKKTADGSYPDWDANVLMMNWDNTLGYSTQLAQRNLTGEIKVRGQNAKTWSGWRNVIDDANVGNYATLSLGAINTKPLGETIATTLTSSGMVGTGTFYNVTDVIFPFSGSNGTRAFMAYRAVSYLRVDAYAFVTNETFTAYYFVTDGTWSTPVRYATTEDTDGLMPVYGNFTGDIDDADIAVGIYALDNFSLTVPSGTRAMFGNLIQCGGTYKTQIVTGGISGESGLLYIRRYLTATKKWSDWYEYQEGIDGKVDKAGDTMTGELYLEKASGDTYFHAKRTDKGNEVWFGVGSAGVNRGVYDGTLKKWLFHTDGKTTFTNGNINIGQVQEWGNASFTYSDGFAAYSTVANNTQEPRASKWGRVVNLTGAFKTTVAREATSSVVIGKVPSGCEPLNDVRVRQQGTGQNSYLLTVGKNGNLTAERYGVATNTAIPNNVWLNINATYISKS